MNELLSIDTMFKCLRAHSMHKIDPSRACVVSCVNDVAYPEGKCDFIAHFNCSQHVYVTACTETAKMVSGSDLDIFGYFVSLARYVDECFNFLNLKTLRTSVIVQRVKAFRLEHFHRSRSGFACFFSGVDDKIVYGDENAIQMHLRYLTVTAGTRNLPFGDQALSELVDKQRQIGCLDHSTLHVPGEEEACRKALRERFFYILGYQGKPKVRHCVIEDDDSSTLYLKSNDGGLKQGKTQDVRVVYLSQEKFEIGFHFLPSSCTF